MRKAFLGKDMATEIDLDDTISLPKNIFYKSYDGYNIIIAPDYPNWIILNEKEYKMFEWLKEGLTIRKSLENYYSRYCKDEDECLAVMTSLLTQIDDVAFSRDVIPIQEEKIENITKKIHIGTTNGCNMHCPHCYMAAGTQTLKTIDLEKTVKLVSEIHELYGELEIVVSGGEPLTYLNFESLLKGIKGNHVILFTNGSLITDKNIDLICDYCDEVQISFEAVSKEYYGLIRGEQNYEKVLHAIELLKKRGKRIILAITILPNTLKDIENNLIDFVKQLQYNNLEVRLNDEIEMTGNALSLDMSNFDKKYSKGIVINLIRELEELGCFVKASDIRNTKYTNCGIGTRVLINYDGKIYPCHKISTYNVDLELDGKEIIQKFNQLNRDTSNNIIDKCKKCELRYICSGGCRIDNYNATGSMIMPICDKNFKDKQYQKLINDFKMYREIW